ncbi:FxSxx-COOH system tetratricopeptide repeat protein [Amycolatopsis orientalis]|uniref:FxSxx-COOH system tetratricopeptide repeat protein n=1 Tax=Amycolatopsis orientalis TaxID=31958 RepID=UPI00191C79A6|nr:FxSxx-COOH system tetratricopeptide repeat protein [Amycolatopsis orientalis]
MGSDARDRFVVQLKQLHKLAGTPSLAALQAQDPAQLARENVSRLLNGKFKRLPPWERISAFVIACVKIGERKKLTMPPQDVLLQQCRHRHEALAHLLEQSSRGALQPASEARSVTPEPPRRRRFGSVPPRAGAFQHRAVAATLTRAVESGGTTVLTGAAATPASVLTGLGGVGKTQLAADHAHTMWDTRRVELLVWISARTRDAITAAYADVAVDLLAQDPADPQRAWRRLLSWFAETTTSWLVVLDDVQAAADLSGLWPPHSSSGQTVVTTRCREAALHGDRRRVVDVDLFTPAEALAYLTEKLPDRARTDTATADLAALADDLGFLPLALAQAAAYLANKPLLTCNGYRAKLADQRNRLRELLPSEGDLPDEHERTVAATWSLSIDAADQLDPAGLARPIMELASLLDPAGIPTIVFTTDAITHHLTARLERDVTADDILGGLECLRRFSLLTLDPDQPHRAVRVHALLQRAVRDTLPVKTVGKLARAAADALLAVWPEVETDQELIQALRANTVTMQDVAESHLWHPDGHSVLFRLADSLGNTGLLESATVATQRLHHQAVTRLGPDHPDTLITRHEIAYWRGEAGDAAGAVTALEELLPEQLRVLGPDHPDTLNTRSNIARWRGEAGDAGGAVTAFEELLADRLRVLGPDHPRTLNTRHEIAYWRGEAGDAAGAVTAFEELLADRLRVLGPDHPRTLNTRHEIAYWRGEAGDAAGAVTALEELLPEQLRVLGPDHPDTLNTRSNIAYYRGKAGDAGGAVTAFEELLADRLRVLGPDHPDTLITRHNIAYYRGKAGDPAGAVTAFEELLADRLRVLGPDHPRTLNTRHEIAYWRGEAGDAAGAVTALEELLPEQLRVLGPDHPDTLNTRSNIAYYRGKAGDAGGAVTAFEELLADRLRVLGPDHPDTLITRHNIAYYRGKAGDPAGAVTAFEELLADRLRVLGPDHPRTLNTRHNIAYWRGEAGDPAGAVTALEELLAEQLRVQRPDHPHTLKIRSNIARWRGEAGDPAGAVTAFEELLADRLRVLGPDHPDTLATRHNIAYWRGEAGDPGRALAAFEEVLTDRLRVLGPDHPDTLVTRNSIARLSGNSE